jgi:hypothetical protein
VEPTAAVVIPSLSGGWIEIGRPTPEVVLNLWHRKHLYDPTNDLGRAVQDGDLVSAVVVQTPETSGSSPIAWSYETQRRFVLFLGSIARMTFRFPQYAAFVDPDGRLALNAEAYSQPSEPPYRRVHVRFHTRVVSPLRGHEFEADLDLQQAALTEVVSSCCAVFPALGPNDYRAALD